MERGREGHSLGALPGPLCLSSGAEALAHGEPHQQQQDDAGKHKHQQLCNEVPAGRQAGAEGSGFVGCQVGTNRPCAGLEAAVQFQPEMVTTAMHSRSCGSCMVGD